jgi:hypothetical protein
MTSVCPGGVPRPPRAQISAIDDIHGAVRKEDDQVVVTDLDTGMYADHSPSDPPYAEGRGDARSNRGTRPYLFASAIWVDDW